MDHLVWVDLETTGLEPQSHVILEIALVITDVDLTVVDEMTRVIKPRERVLRSALPPDVLAMHSRAGLLDDVAAATQRLDAVEAEARLFMETHFGPKKVRADGTPARHQMPLMGGSSVHFDRAFLQEHMPTLERHFHYRNFDATTLGEAARRWYPEQFTEPEKQKLHRALPDLHDTLAELRYIRETFFR